jgi:hypothetical protein
MDAPFESVGMDQAAVTHCHLYLGCEIPEDASCILHWTHSVFDDPVVDILIR